MKSWKIGAVSGLIAGIIAGIMASFCNTLLAIIGFPILFEYLLFL